MFDASKVNLITTRAVMAALGGTHAVAKLTNRKYSAAANWLLSFDGKEPAFPSNTYLAITRALAAVDKTAPASLWGMVAVPVDDEADTSEEDHEGPTP